MALGFPNENRYYDEATHVIRFWGHDGAMEAAFFVSQEAFKTIQPGMPPDEAGLLSAFDAYRDGDPQDGHQGVRPRPQGRVRPSAD